MWRFYCLKRNLTHCSFNTKQRKCERNKNHIGNQPFYVLVLDLSFKTKQPQTCVISMSVSVYEQGASGPKSVLKSCSHRFFCLGEAAQGHTGGAGWQLGKNSTNISRQATLEVQENRDCRNRGFYPLAVFVRALLTEAWPPQGWTTARTSRGRC